MAVIERWLKLAEGVGFTRDYVLSTKGILSATRFSVDAYVHFVSERSCSKRSPPRDRDVLADDHLRACRRDA